MLSSLKNVLNSNKTDKSAEVMKIISDPEKGVYSVIDKSRDVIDLLRKEAPEFMASNFWVIDFLTDQDKFLKKIADTVDTTTFPIEIQKKIKNGEYPRPFPSRVFNEKTE